MQVGVIGEGPADLAVLSNLLIGILGIDREQITFLRPELTRDATDLHSPGAQHFSNWGLVRQECINREKIREFLDSPVLFDDDDRRFVVVQIDTAECHLYGVARPDRKSDDYPQELLKRVRAKMEEWLGGTLSGVIRAVAVEETDAWVLALYETEETDRILDPKKRLEKVASRHGLTWKNDPFQTYRVWSADLRKSRPRAAATEKNHSLRVLVEELKSQISAGD